MKRGILIGGLLVAILLAGAHAKEQAATVACTGYPAYADGAANGTPFAVHVSISGWTAAADSDAYVKANRSGTTGANYLIWNGTSWNNAAYYANCPRVRISTSGDWSGWILVKANGASTTSLKAAAETVGKSRSLSEDAPHSVAYLDMSTTGAWVEATAAASTAGLAVLAFDASDNLIGTYAVEDNGVSEGYPSTAGYFKMAVPANTAIRRLEVQDHEGNTIATQTSALWGSGVAGSLTNLDDQYDVSLPVTLTSLQAAVVEGGVKVSWTTESEINNRGFYVLRSDAEGAAYRTISPLIPGAGSSVVPRAYEYVDRTVVPAQSYWYLLRQEDFGGQAELFGPVAVYVPPAPGGQEPALPTRSALVGGYPNPFNPGTTVRFVLAAEQEVEVAVFDLHGRRVRTLVQGVLAPGEHSARWDGRDGAGADVPAGMYLCRLTCADGLRETAKLIKLR